MVKNAPAVQHRRDVAERAGFGDDGKRMWPARNRQRNTAFDFGDRPQCRYSHARQHGASGFSAGREEPADAPGVRDNQVAQRRAKRACVAARQYGLRCGQDEDIFAGGQGCSKMVHERDHAHTIVIKHRLFDRQDNDIFLRETLGLTTGHG
jgi:hypothetical protein